MSILEIRRDICTVFLGCFNGAQVTGDIDPGHHGVQVEGVPRGFKLLASSYLCKNQMMVRRNGGQLIYCVQFHLEKSFEDWSKNPTRWEHPNESRDGRILFENFLELALIHDKK